MIVSKGNDYEHYALSVSSANKFRPHIRVSDCDNVNVTCYDGNLEAPDAWIFLDGSTTVELNIWYHAFELMTIPTITP